MKYRKVTAILPALELSNVEQALIDLGVSGMSVSSTHGFGEYRNYFAKDTMTDCVRVEIFADADEATEIARTIARTAHKGLESDGIVAILPAEMIWHIRDYHEQ
ncbi:nitrogen regulatory protein P-II [Salinisphaera sp. PC39]|uniref:P-II family nitrogen regulator n=1 Tax=Salinisphaera sp. PC39 TaxID=1304156 RepID=UPI00333F2F84